MAMDAGVCFAVRSRRIHFSRDSAVRRSPSSARISRAKRAAPAPTSMTCGSRSITARATVNITVPSLKEETPEVTVWPSSTPFLMMTPAIGAVTRAC